MDQLNLKIITPDRIFFDGQVDKAVFKSTEGELAILYDHIPITALIDSSSFTIIQGDEEKVIAVHGGYFESRDDRLTVLTDSAEWPYELDVDRAKAAVKRAEERLAQDLKDDIDLIRAEVSLKRALTRIEVAEFDKGR
ncbi:ATP synthase F1 subunit epsilon [Vallitalea okinawensis]|uniref:ATP synthase F1 subunit epsilon n=1 Tax=Vallitalea okinawensis TaxID=2078660 RepID=UPI001300473A|nr:ATP synthase F1 subunit epsilon [Vallitalea okinawensis]